MEINIDTKDIQEAVVKAISDSAIGEQVTKVIQEQFTAKKNSWDSETMMEAAISEEIRRVISLILREEIESKKEEIRALVTPMLTDEIIKDMGSAAFEVMLGTLRNR